MTIKCPECKSKNISLHPDSGLPSADWKQMSDGRFRATVDYDEVTFDEGDALVSCNDCTMEFGIYEG